MLWDPVKSTELTAAWTNAQVGKYVRAIWEAESKGESNRRTLHEIGLAKAMNRRKIDGSNATRPKMPPREAIERIFSRYLDALKEWKRQRGIRGRMPILTPARRSMIGRCWRQFQDAGENPEEWCSAAGLGLFLSEWHRDRQLLRPENAWEKISNATRHAERYFKERELNAN